MTATTEDSDADYRTPEDLQENRLYEVARDYLTSGTPDFQDADPVAILRGELEYARLIIKMSRDSIDQDHPTAARNRLDVYLREHPRR